MSDLSRQPGRPAEPGAGRTLTDRVRDQVGMAAATLDRRPASGGPRRRRPTRPAETTTPPRLTRELRALRIVFRDLGETHRRYRRQHGLPVSPALRSAAIAFRQEPSLISLLPVATYLDELGLLEW